MGFTEEQLQKIKTATQEVHNNIYSDIVNNLKIGLRDMQIPEGGAIKEEYRPLYASIREFRNALNRIVDAGVSMDEERDHQNESLLSQHFDQGPIRREGIDDEIDIPPVSPTLSNLQNQFERIMARNNGDAMEDGDFQRASILLHQLSALKNTFVLRRMMFEAHKKKIKVEEAKQNIANYEKVIKDHIEKTQRYMKENEDFTILPRTLQRLKKELHDIQEELHLEEWVLVEAPSKNPEIAILFNDVEMYTEAANECEEKAKTLDYMQLQVDEIVNGCRTKYEAFDNLRAELDRMGEMVKTEEKNLKDIQTDIDSQNENIKKMQWAKEQLFNDKSLTPKAREILKEALEPMRRAETKKEIMDLVNDPDVNSLVNNWLGTFSGKTEKDLQKHLDMQAPTLCGRMNREGERYLKVRRIIESLVYDYKMAPNKVKEALCFNRSTAFLVEISNRHLEDKNQLADLSKKFFKAHVGANKIDIIEATSSIISMDRQIASSRDSIKALKELAKGSAEKILQSNERILELQDKIQDNGVAAWIKGAFEKLNTLSKMQAISDKVPEDFAENFKKSLTTVKVKNDKGSVKEYKDRLSSLLSVSNQLKGMIGSKQDDVQKQLENTKNKIEANKKKIDDIRNEITKEQKEKVDKLKAKEEKTQTAVNMVTSKIGMQTYLINKHRSVQEETLRYNRMADSMVPGLENGLAKNVLDTMLSKYRSLNDARYWRGNSQEYREMVEPLCHLLGLPIPAYKQPVKNARYDMATVVKSKEEILANLATIKEKAQAYIAAKLAGISRKTRQSFQRLTLADELIRMSDELTKNIKLVQSVSQDFVPAQREFNEAAKLMAPIKNDENAEFAYGNFLNDVAAGNPIKASYDPNAPVVEPPKPETFGFEILDASELDEPAPANPVPARRV